MGKRNVILLIIVLIFLAVISLTKDTVTSFLLASRMKEDNLQIGEVKVIARVYYEVDGELHQAQEIKLTESEVKKGVYFVNLSDTDALEYIDNLSVKVYVYSDVDTYIRIKLIEQLTVVKDSALGKKEYAIPFNEPINYHINNDWFLYEDFYYYPNKLQRQDENTPTEIAFVLPQSQLLTTTYNEDHFLQLAIRLESVQALLGPQKNWGMDQAPWGGEW